MICKKCGKKLTPGDKFCSGCGEKVIDDSPLYPDFSVGSVTKENTTEESAESGKSYSYSFEIEDFDWDLDGFPEDEKPEKAPEEPVFNWDSVIEKKVEEETPVKPVDKEEMKFDWGLGTTARFDREELEKKEKQLKEIESKRLETEKEFVEKNKDEKIDRFFTFNEKHEEFQELLDKEYDKLRNRIKEESAAEEVINQKEERLKNARESWKGNWKPAETVNSDDNIETGFEEEYMPTPKFELQPDNIMENALSDDLTETDELNEDEFVDEFVDEIQETFKGAPERTDEGYTVLSISQPLLTTMVDATGGEEKKFYVNDLPELDNKIKEQLSDTERIINSLMGNRREAEFRNVPEVESEKTEQDVSEISADDLAEKEPEDEAPITKKAPGEIFKEDYEIEEEPPKREKNSRWKIVLVDIIIVVLIAIIILASIMIFAGDSIIGRKLNNQFNKIVMSEKDGEHKAGQQADDPEPTDGMSEMGILIQKQSTRNKNIKVISEDANLVFQEGKDYGYEEVSSAAFFRDKIWFSNDEGETVSYGDEVVGVTIEYYSELVGKLRDGSENITKLVEPDTDLADKLAAQSGKDSSYSIENLSIGEIRVSGNDWYVLADIKSTVSKEEGGLGASGNYVVHILTENTTAKVKGIASYS